MIKRLTLGFAIAALFTLDGWEYLNYSNLSLGLGYREDSLNWNIANSDGHPNVLSELTWKDLQMFQVYAGYEAKTYYNLYLKVEGDYAHIDNGYNQDFDFAADNRKELFSYSRNKAGKGEAWDASGALGYVFNIGCSNVAVRPLAGWSQHEQHLRQYDGYQVFYDSDLDPSRPGSGIDFTGPIYGLHSNYRTRWRGPWVGGDFLMSLQKVFVTAGFEYHWPEYKGVGHWNLRDDFADDFVHKGWGQGTKIRLKVQYQAGTNTSFALETSYTNFRLVSGTDHTFFFDEVGPPIPPGAAVPVVVGKTRLNEVNWHSFVIQGNLVYRF
jgi:hypothetical protein